MNSPTNGYPAARASIASERIAVLQDAYPQAFPTDPDSVRPLARTVAAAIGQDRRWSPDEARGVLGAWTARTAYCAALARHQHRVDLAGAPTDERVEAVARTVAINILHLRGAGAAPPHQPPPLPPVTLIGHPFLSVGRGEHIRAIRRALAQAGIAAKVYDLIRRPTRQEPATADLDASIVEQLGGGIRIFHCNGDELAHGLSLLDERQPGIFARGYNIVFPAWELPLFPADWARQIERFDEVWSASGFVDAALRQAVSIPVVHIPNACEPQITEPLERAHFGLPQDDFTILFFFDTFSYTSRKNPWAVIETMRQVLAARPGSRVHLVIKINHGAHFPALVAEVVAALGDLAGRTTVIDRTITDNEAKNLIRCCDCFLSLHRSEGFGRGPAEAMFFGRPAVATGWSGNMEYMNDRVSFPIGFDLVPVREGDYPRWENQVWAEPRTGEAVRVIIGLIDRPRSARAIGARARAHMRRLYSDKALGRRYAERFAAIAAAGGVPAEEEPLSLRAAAPP